MWTQQLEQPLRPSIQTKYRRMLSTEETDKRVLVTIFRELVFELTKSHCTRSFDDVCCILEIMRKEESSTFTMEEGIFEEIDLKLAMTHSKPFSKEKFTPRSSFLQHWTFSLTRLERPILSTKLVSLLALREGLAMVRMPANFSTKTSPTSGRQCIAGRQALQPSASSLRSSR